MDHPTQIKNPTIGDVVWFWRTHNGITYYYPDAALVVNCNHEVSAGRLTLRVFSVRGEDVTVMGASTCEQDLVAYKPNGEKFVISGHWSPKHADLPFSELNKSSHPGVLPGITA